MSQTGVNVVSKTLQSFAKNHQPGDQGNASHQVAPGSQDRAHTTSDRRPQSPQDHQDVSPNTSNTTTTATPPTRTVAQTATIMTSLCACVFVAALEVTIVSTALPSIAGHFASASGYTWIGTAYILAHTASTPSWGSLSDIWGRPPILLGAAAVFFAGSLLCAVVDLLDVFIAGRALQGLGAGGMQTVVNICIGDMFSQRDRGLYYGLTSVMWAAASAVGPVIGGVFTTKLSWRWCFWINLPITGAAFLLLFFTLKLPSPNTPIRAGLKAIDWTGSALIVGGSLMLLLGLYLGGVYEPWNSATVICLIAFSFLAGSLFVLNEWKVARYPIIPLRLFQTQSSAAAFGVCFFHSFAFLGMAYYLPLYFQSVLLASPLKAGVYLLPFILSVSITAALTGVYIQKTGKYMPAVYLGLATMTLGMGLFIVLGFDTHWARLVTFQLISGIGVGMNFEGPLLAVQAAHPSRDVGTATASMGFVRTLATAISVVIGGVVFQNEMHKRNEGLKQVLGPKLAALLDGASASANIEIVKSLPPAQQVVARRAYYESARSIWVMYVAFSASGLILGFLIRGHHLRKDHEVTRLGLERDEGETRAVRSTGLDDHANARDAVEMRSLPSVVENVNSRMR